MSTVPSPSASAAAAALLAGRMELFPGSPWEPCLRWRPRGMAFSAGLSRAVAISSAIT